MEVAESTTSYTSEAEEDAQKSRKVVEKKGGRVHLLQADLRKQKAARRLLERLITIWVR